MNNIPLKCPSCADPLVVTQLTCATCRTGVVGHFELNPFLKLSNQSLRFLEDFIRNRGNVKEMARVSGESYWVIRRQLDEVITELGMEEFEPSERQPEPSSLLRQQILERLGNGDINVQEATRLLAQLTERSPF